MGKVVFNDNWPGDVWDVTPKNGKTFTLKELQTVVDGYIQPINLTEGRTMYVNEDGLTRRLMPNAAATKIVNEEFSVKNRMPLIQPGGIRGNVIIISDAETPRDEDEG